MITETPAGHYVCTVRISYLFTPVNQRKRSQKKAGNSTFRTSFGSTTTIRFCRRGSPLVYCTVYKTVEWNFILRFFHCTCERNLFDSFNLKARIIILTFLVGEIYARCVFTNPRQRYHCVVRMLRQYRWWAVLNRGPCHTIADPGFLTAIVLK